MSNPFEDEHGTYVVLTNDAGQCSLWPTAIEVPAGWITAYGPSGRGECVGFVEANWRL